MRKEIVLGVILAGCSTAVTFDEAFAKDSFYTLLNSMSRVHDSMEDYDYTLISKSKMLSILDDETYELRKMNGKLLDAPENQTFYDLKEAVNAVGLGYVELRPCIANNDYSHCNKAEQYFQYASRYVDKLREEFQ